MKGAITAITRAAVLLGSIAALRPVPAVAAAPVVLESCVPPPEPETTYVCSMLTPPGCTYLYYDYVQWYTESGCETEITCYYNG